MAAHDDLASTGNTSPVARKHAGPTPPIPVLERASSAPDAATADAGGTTAPTEAILTDGAIAPDDATSVALRNMERRRRARRRKRLIRVAIVVGAIVALVAGTAIVNMLNAAGAGGGGPATAVVTRGDLTSSVSASGKAEPISSTVVTPEVDGIIENLQVAEGTTVNAGDVLFTLRNDSLDKAVREASQQVRSAEVGVNGAQASLDSARSNYNTALNAWNSAPDGETQATLTDPDTLYDAVVSAQSSLEAAQVTLQGAREAYDEAVATAGKRTVKAPISGSVVAVGAVAGASTASSAAPSQQGSNTPLVQIADVSQMTVTAQVNEVDISKLAVDQTATVTFSALPGTTMDARITHIATVATSGAEGAGVVTYSVELLIPNPDPSLKPGMTASATIVTQSVTDALIAPVAALSTHDDGTTTVDVVTYAADGSSIESVETREVTVVAQNSNDAAVEGLSEGDVLMLPSADGATGIGPLSEGSAGGSSDTAGAGR
ncbi:efflux RND transporter periplasmic adaptor subunit [Olsenella uli]|uniref:efflux RND transporter periplasmic adaptor subunit n=1 Tax=Olsenella uli TaxID=133926 RepID=UPI000451F45C|nr:efflux RND transporter periplasmic adaptor subunit [Olsenella uli]EUB32279.1 HlyD family secretion protein [Olsenella uli MSTE5]